MKLAIVYFNHVSVSYVEAEKVSTANTFPQAEQQLKQAQQGARRPDMYGICNDFEGDSINADRIQLYEQD